MRRLLDQTLQGMKRNKTCADDGLVAEMLQTQCEPLLQAMAVMFTDLLNGAAAPPPCWRATKLIVLFKKGDVKLPKNYRPIAIIPVMCKVLAGILLRRSERS